MTQFIATRCRLRDLIIHILNYNNKILGFYFLWLLTADVHIDNLEVELSRHSRNTYNSTDSYEQLRELRTFF